MIKQILFTLLALSVLPLTSEATVHFFLSIQPHYHGPTCECSPIPIRPNFPIYLVLNDSALKTVANGGHVQSSTGADIAFFGDSALTKVLPFEVVSYNGATGALTAVVNYPLLSHSADTVFYLGYGMAGAVSLANPTSVWSQYLGVYHMEDDAANKTILNSATGDVIGRSANNTAGMSCRGETRSRTKVQRQYGSLDLGPYSAMNNAGAATYSGWVNFASVLQLRDAIVGRMDSNNAGFVIGLGSNDCCSERFGLVDDRAAAQWRGELYDRVRHSAGHLVLLHFRLFWRYAKSLHQWNASCPE